MPLILIIIAVIALDVAARGTEHEFAAQLGKDFASKTFVAWLAAILILGGIGYYSPARGISNALLGLVILSMLLANRGGVFTQLSNVISNPPAPSSPVQLSSYESTSSVGNTSGGIFGGLGNLLGIGGSGNSMSGGVGDIGNIVTLGGIL